MAALHAALGNTGRFSYNKVLSIFYPPQFSKGSSKSCRRNLNIGDTVSSGCKVLYLNSSGLDNRSLTGRTANEFIEKYAAFNPGHVIEEIRLWDKQLLYFNLSHVESKIRIDAGKQLHQDKLNFSAVEEMVSQLLGASKLIVSCPMWNFSVPYVLKQYIDCVVQPELTFRETDEGFESFVTGRPLLLISSSAWDFSREPLKSLDFQVPFLKAVFGLIGFQDFRSIHLGNTKKISKEELLQYARERVDEELARF